MPSLRIIARLIDYFLIFLVIGQLGQTGIMGDYGNIGTEIDLSPIAASNYPDEQLIFPTHTPFQPGNAKPIPTFIYPQEYPFEAVALAPGELPAAIEFDQFLPEPSMKFIGINFNNRQENIHLKIDPKKRAINRGKTISVKFVPGKRCEFGDKRACAYSYLNEIDQNMIFVSIHSGVGGEAQRLRHAIEGTWINSAAFSLSKVRDNLDSLAGSRVSISQQNRSFQGELVAMGRIPAKAVDKYVNSSISEALDIGARFNPKLKSWVLSPEPLLIIETCGWRMPGEAWSRGTSDTTGSIYLGVIRLVPDQTIK